MAGRPRRRARLEAMRDAELALPERDKPVAEMTAAERGEYMKALRRVLRDDEVRRGKRTPRTMREMEIFLEALDERDARRPGGSPPAVPPAV